MQPPFLRLTLVLSLGDITHFLSAHCSLDVQTSTQILSKMSHLFCLHESVLKNTDMDKIRVLLRKDNQVVGSIGSLSLE